MAQLKTSLALLYRRTGPAASLITNSFTHFCERKFSSTLNSGVIASLPCIKPSAHLQKLCSYSRRSCSNVSSFIKEQETETEDLYEVEEGLLANSDGAIDAIFEDCCQMTDTQWTEVIQRLHLTDPTFNEKSCDALIMRRCHKFNNHRLATSFLSYIERQGREANLATLSFYLRLCGNSECEKEKILEVYYHLMRKVKMLDANLSESVILALCSTPEWRQALKHLSTIRKMCSVSAKVYSAIIAAAFTHGDYDTGWQFLETMRAEEKVPNDRAVLAWIRKCDEAENEKQMGMLSTLFRKFNQYEIFPSTNIIENIARLFANSQGWTGLHVRLNKDGKCPSCQQQLNLRSIEAEDFENLRKEFVPRVLQGSDIFRSTSPEEWDGFQRFLQQRGPFAVVIDGLNVAYMAGKGSQKDKAVMLRKTVEKLKTLTRGGRILVIGRKHMKNWSHYDLSAVERIAEVYTLANVTRDDGFFIHATLQSGLGTQFVSSDMLRDHLFRLGDVQLRETFRHWQRRHQLFIVPYPGGVNIVRPTSFSTTIQNHDTSWHVPYDTGAPRQSYEVPDTWLCLQSSPECQSTDGLSTSNGRVRPTPFTAADVQASIPPSVKKIESGFKKNDLQDRKYISGQREDGFKPDYQRGFGVRDKANIPSKKSRRDEGSRRDPIRFSSDDFVEKRKKNEKSFRIHRNKDHSTSIPRIRISDLMKKDQ